MKKALLYIFTIITYSHLNIAIADISDADTIYLMAASDNISGLEAHIKFDATDKNGDTFKKKIGKYLETNENGNALL